MLAMELNETQHAGWTLRRHPNEFEIIRVLRSADRVKIIMHIDGDVHTHTANPGDTLDVQPPARLTAAGIAAPVDAPTETPVPVVDLLAGFDWAEQNLIMSGLHKLHFECIRSAEQYGIEATAEVLADPRVVGALIEKLRDNARARHAA